MHVCYVNVFYVSEINYLLGEWCAVFVSGHGFSDYEF